MDHESAANETFLEMPEAQSIRLIDIMAALSDPGRLKMLNTLADGEWHPCSLDAWQLDLQKSTVSHHLKTLREAGLVEYRMRGRNKDARLRRTVIDERFPGLLDGLTSAEASADATR